MKIILVFTLLFSCVFAYPQEDKLPQNIQTAFTNKYPKTKIDDWRLDGSLYYIDHSAKANSYTAVFDKNAAWLETSEVITDSDIPAQVKEFLKTYFPENEISFCENVQTVNARNLIRVNIFSNEKFIVIQSESNGSNIKVIKEQNE